MTVTELIGDTYKDWINGSIVTIKAGTGKGKSHWIMNILYEYAKQNNQKILFLIHRTNCIDQFQYELEQNNKTDVIDIKTYQHIESNESFDFSPYTYLVSDEFHYFIGDASFNPTTDISLNNILKQSNTIKIFMSATGDYVTKYFKNILKLDIKEYKLPIEYNFINELNFFSKNETLELLIKDSIKDNQKTIVFLDSATEAYCLYKKYKKYSLFNCSRDNKLHRYTTKDKIKEMLHNEKFEELLLFTTTCMDAGVNIKDKSLTKIICDVKDTNTLIQCIGRKRMIGNDDKVNLYIKLMNKFTLGGRYKQATDKKERATYLKDHSIYDYIMKYGRKKDTSQIVYDLPIKGEKDKLTKKINELMYYKYMFDGLEVDTIQSYQFGHAEYLSKVLKQSKYTLIEKEFKNMKLEEYLNSIVGMKLFKEEQVQLKEVFKQNGLSARTLGINTLNGNLKDRKLNYMIVSKQSSTIENGKKKSFRYWEVLNDVIN